MRKVGLFLLRQGSDRQAALAESLRHLLEALRNAPREPAPPEPTRPPGRGHEPTRIENGRIWTPEGLAPAGFSEAIMRYWPQSVWTDAAWVSYHESGWRKDARRSTLDQAGGRCNVLLGYLPNGMAYYSEESVGYFQINRCSHGGSRSDWEDTENNVRKGAELYRSNGWEPWTYTATMLGLL